jgi:hypothetical protein
VKAREGRGSGSVWDGGGEAQIYVPSYMRFSFCDKIHTFVKRD